MLFGKKKADEVPAVVVEETVHLPTDKKGRPTPTRKEAQAANRRPLVPSDPGLRRAQNKSERRRMRELEYQALQGGDPRYLPYKDRGPVRAFIRDWIDGRRTISEFFLAFALIGMLGMFVATRLPSVALVAVVVLYAIFVAVIAENIFLARKLKKEIIAKFGEDAVVRGTLMYMVSRNTQIRRLRLPKPTVKPGRK